MDFEFSDKPTLNVTYYLNDDNQSVYKNVVEIKNPSLEKIKMILRKIEEQYLDKGLWLNAKFKFDNVLWEYIDNTIIPTNDDYIGGELVHLNK